MWTDTRSDPDLDRGPATPDLVAYYVERGRQLRSEELTRLARRAFARLRRPFGRTHRPDGLPDAQLDGRPDRRGDAGSAGVDDPVSVLASDFRSPLTAIRSSAEILRDNPDIDSARRRRFVDIVLMEEARLEALVSQILDSSDIERGARAWRPELDRAKLEPAQVGRP